MRAIVTCGPSFEPIDEVRRLTNFSTGELGTLLAEALVEAGVETVCLRGTAATFARLPAGAQVIPFSTNGDLTSRLRELAEQQPWTALFHAAALADYRVASIRDAEGQALTGAKITTGTASVLLHLEPAAKVLPQLREWFPASRIVGWKYEVDGTPERAVHRGAVQIQQCRTDACVVNGRAFGTQFGVLDPAGKVDLCPTKEVLSLHLAQKFLR